MSHSTVVACVFVLLAITALIAVLRFGSIAFEKLLSFRADRQRAEREQRIKRYCMGPIRGTRARQLS